MALKKGYKQYVTDWYAANGRSLQYKFEPLQNALLGAFRDKTKLNMMLLPAFKKPLNQLAGGENYTELVFNLLIEIDSQGKVTDLIRAANRKEPSNPALREFCNNHHQALIEDACQENLSKLPPEQVNNLVAIVQQINDFETVVKAVKNTLPPDSYDPENALKDLENAELVTVLRLYALLRLILKWFPQGANNIPRILELAEVLEEAIGPTNNLSQQLQGWIQEIRQTLALDSTSDGSQAPTVWRRARTRGNTLQASLMLTVQPTTQQSQDKKPLYRVQACLYFDRLKNTPSPDGQPLRPAYVLTLPEHGDQASLECVFDDIPNQTDQYVNLALKTLENRTFRDELGYRLFELMVEVFLPIEHLDKPVDQWSLTRPGRGEDVPLGRGIDRTMTSVVVRSFNRFDPFETDTFKLTFEDAWLDWQEQLHQNQPLPIEHIENWENHQAQNLEACFYQKAAIKISGGLPGQATNREKLFRAAIDSHIPTAVWTRQCELQGVIA